MRNFLLPMCCCLTVLGWSPALRAGDAEDFQYAAALMGEREEFAQAAEKFAEFVQNSPQSQYAAQALFYRGGCLTRLKQDAPAAQAYEAMVRQYRDAPAQLRQEALSYGADAWFRAGEFAKAASLYSQLLQEYPGTNWAESALYWRGECRTRLAQAEGGADSLRLAQADYALFVERYPQSKLRADVLYAAGAGAGALKDYPASRKYFLLLTSEFPDDVHAEEALYHAADSLYWQGDYDGAGKEFTALIARFPGGKLAAETRAGLGWCAYAKKEYANAGLGFAEAARLQKDPARAADHHYDAGVAFELAGESPAAVRELEFVAQVKDHPRRTQALARMGGISRKAAMREPAGSAARKLMLEKTADALAQAVAAGEPAQKEWAGWAALLGDTRFDLGRFAEAAQIFRRVAQECPGNSFAPYALYQLSLAEAERKEFAPAAEAIRELLRAYPDSPLRLQAAYAMADYQLALREEDRARKAYLWLCDESVAWAGQVAAHAAGDDAAGVRDLVERAKELAAKSLLRLGELSYAKAMPEGAAVAEAEQGRAAGLAQARTYFSRLAKEYPQSGYAPAACLRLGEIAQAAGEFATAAEQYDLAVNLAQMRQEQETDQRRRGELAQIALYGDYRGAVSLALGAQQTPGPARERAAHEALEAAEKFIRAQTGGKAGAEAGPLAERMRYYRAELLYLLGRKDEAAADYLACYQAQPAGQLADAALFGLGWSLNECGQKKESRTRMEELLRVFPQSEYAAEGLLLLAGFKRESGEAEGALEDLRQARTRPGATRCATRIAVEEGRTLNALKRYSDAQRMLETVKGNAPEAGGKSAAPELAQALYALSWAYWGQAEPYFAAAARAGEDLRTIKAGGDAAKAKALQISRDEQLAQGRIHEDRMIAALTRLLRDYPDFAAAGEVSLRLGETAYDRQDYRGALMHYEKALGAATPAILDKIRYRIAWSSLRLAQGGATAATGASAAAPDEADKRAMTARALQEFAEVANNLPKSPLAGECAWRAAELLRAEGNHARALVLYEKAAELPGGTEVRQGAGYGRALCLLELKRYGEAMGAFKEFLRAYPQSPLLHEANWGAGYAALQVGAGADARDFFQAAKSGDYGGEAAAKARYGLGLLALNEKNYRVAREEFRKVDVFHPQWSEVAALALVKAAEASRELGEAAAAAKDLERVVNRYGKTDPAMEARRMLAAMPKAAAN